MRPDVLSGSQPAAWPRQAVGRIRSQLVARRRSFLLLFVAVFTFGCQSHQELRDLNTFLDEVPHASLASSARVAETASPPGGVAPVSFQQPVEPTPQFRSLNQETLRPFGLNEAIQIAFQNAAIIRDRNDFLSPNNRLLNRPGQMASAYDVPLQQSSGQGVEAALAAFDAQVALGAQWGRNALIQGNRYRTSNVASPDLLATNNGSFYARYDKPLDRGGVFSLIPSWNYALNSLPQQSFSSQFAGFMRAEYRQPLLAGRGKQVTDIAGPFNYRGETVGRGVALAQIDEHVAMLDHDAQLQRLVLQTEESYWDLWLAFQRLRSQVAARESAHESWQRVERRAAAGLEGGGAADAAEAEENFHQRRSQVAAAEAEVFDAELRLRRLIGFTPGQQGVLHPTETPGEAPIAVDWNDAFTQAIVRRTELQKSQLWANSLELQLVAARNMTLPQLDLVTGLQANGLGDGGGASNGVFDPDKVGWNAGLEFSMPIGFRRPKAQVRHLELQVTKARIALDAQQSEVGLELAHAIRNLNHWRSSFESTTARLAAARRRVAAVLADYEAGRTSIDRLLRSQDALAEAETMRARSLAQYNKGFAQFQYRRGDILDSRTAFAAMPSPADEPINTLPQPRLNRSPNIRPPGNRPPLNSPLRTAD